MRDATSAVREAADDVAPWIERLARVGYVAKAVLYMTVGGLALGPIGSGREATDSRGAMTWVLDAPFGRALLAIVAAGLLGYAVWRVVQGVADPERRGSDAKGIALRTSFVARGLIHAALALSAATMVIRRAPQGGEDGARSRDMAARVMDLPAGAMILGLIAASFVAYGIYQLYRGVMAKLSKRLDLSSLSPATASWVKRISRFGIAARGIVFGTIGVLLGRAALQHDSSEAGGTADSLRELMNLGRWPFAAIAIGLAAYGVYELLNARYRRIRV